MRFRFWKKSKAPEVEWTDPLDPHGDGTLRPGDPIYDMMMKDDVKPVLGNYTPDNGWVYTQ